MAHMKAIAIQAEEGWPVDAVVVDRDDPGGPLYRWREGSLSDAPEVEVDVLLADASWRWLDIELPENFEEGYIASWKGKVKWVRGTPPIVPSWLPRWTLTIPNPDRALVRLQRRVPQVEMIAGAFGFVIGLVFIAAGDDQAWVVIAWSIALLSLGWMARHQRALIRTFAIRVVPVLFFSLAAAVTAHAAAQAFSSNNAARGCISRRCLARRPPRRTPSGPWTRVCPPSQANFEEVAMNCPAVGSAGTRCIRSLQPI
jgi:hypothetical protein